MSSQTYSISDLSRELDITTRAIRFYEEQGLLSPERRGLERIYSARDKVTLKLILRGKRIGFSLAECRELIELYDPTSGNLKQLNSMLAKIAERRAQLEQQMLDIQHLLVFGDLEDDALQWEAKACSGIQSGANTGFRLVDGVGHEVDRQQSRQVQARAQFDRLDPAGLVEGIEIVGIHLLQQ